MQGTTVTKTNQWHVLHVQLCTACTAAHDRLSEMDRGHCQLSATFYLRPNNKVWTQKLTKWLVNGMGGWKL